jgi:hypothetical protein
MRKISYSRRVCGCALPVRMLASQRLSIAPCSRGVLCLVGKERAPEGLNDAGKEQVVAWLFECANLVKLA